MPVQKPASWLELFLYSFQFSALSEVQRPERQLNLILAIMADRPVRSSYIGSYSSAAPQSSCSLKHFVVVPCIHAGPDSDWCITMTGVLQTRAPDSPDPSLLSFTGLAFSDSERDRLYLRGLLPPVTLSQVLAAPWLNEPGIAAHRRTQ